MVLKYAPKHCLTGGVQTLIETDILALFISKLDPSLVKPTERIGKVFVGDTRSSHSQADATQRHEIGIYEAVKRATETVMNIELEFYNNEFCTGASMIACESLTITRVSHN